MQETVHNRFIVIDLLFWISLFGVAVCIFLWIRDIRIWMRSGLPGYRKAAIKGIFEAPLATLGAGIVYFWPQTSILGAGIVLLALYLQGNEAREKVWTTEPPVARFFGSVPIKKSKR